MQKCKYTTNVQCFIEVAGNIIVDVNLKLSIPYLNILTMNVRECYVQSSKAVFNLTIDTSDILTPADLTDTYLKMCLTYVIIRDLKISHVKIKRKIN